MIKAKVLSWMIGDNISGMMNDFGFPKYEFFFEYNFLLMITGSFHFNSFLSRFINFSESLPHEHTWVTEHLIEFSAFFFFFYFVPPLSDPDNMLLRHSINKFIRLSVLVMFNDIRIPAIQIHKCQCRPWHCWLFCSLSICCNHVWRNKCTQWIQRWVCSNQ